MELKKDSAGVRLADQSVAKQGPNSLGSRLRAALTKKVQNEM